MCVILSLDSTRAQKLRATVIIYQRILYIQKLFHVRIFSWEQQGLRNYFLVRLLSREERLTGNQGEAVNHFEGELKKNIYI